MFSSASLIARGSPANGSVATAKDKDLIHISTKIF